MSATYRESPAPEPLASHACCVWSHVAGPGGHVERVLPDGCADVVWIEGEDIVVAGPATREVLVAHPGRRRRAGRALRPGRRGRRPRRRRARAARQHGGARRTSGARRRSSWPSACPPRRGRTASPCSPPRSRGASTRPARPDALVARASALLGAGMPVTAASREVALTDRHLRRRFHDAVGYGPKTLQRVLRLRRFLALAESGPSRRPRARRGRGGLLRPAAPHARVQRPGGPAAGGAAGVARRRLRLGRRRPQPARSRNGAASPGSSSSATRSASPISTSCTS